MATIALAWFAYALPARAITLTLEDLPGDMHEGGSVASEYDQYIHLNVSGFGTSQVTINVTVNGSSALIDLGLLSAGTLSAPNWAFPGSPMTVPDPQELNWQGVFEGPESATVTFQAVDERGNKSTLLTRHFTVRAAGVPPPNPNATIDRHPERKSRAVAWTEFDGSYNFDTSSRAEMLDVFWNVFNKPYGDHGWTGSANPPLAGGISERWRVREYAQLNAYRWLNGSAPVNEDPAKLDFVQAPALVFAQNTDKPISHVITASYVGYNTAAAFAAAQSLLNGTGDDSKDVPIPTFYLDGAADIFVADAERENAASVGHRFNLLHNNSTVGALGSSAWGGAFTNVWFTPFLRDNVASPDRFIAYPSPGYFPNAMIPTNVELFTWSFVTASDLSYCTPVGGAFIADPGVVLKNATVTATINGVDAPVNDLVLGSAPAPITWNFGTALNNAPDGTKVEITIRNVAILNYNLTHVTGYRDYSYTVTLFDPMKVVPANYSPRTPLVNVSTRGVIGNSDQQVIAGFTVSGSEPVRVAVRAQGPGLKAYGIQNAAGSTHIRVYDQATNTLMGENAGWRNHPNWRLLQSLNVAPIQDNEAAEVLTLWPGSYTAVVSDDTGANGVGIVEAFDIDNLSESKLVNVSTRGLVGIGENQLIAGIVIKDTPRTVVIRTQGPGLTKYGVAGAVSDTVLSVVAQSDGHTVATNDDWQTDPANSRLTTDLAPYAPSDPRESALVLTLQPGAYTAPVSAKGAPGVGIVEVFDVTQ